MSAIRLLPVPAVLVAALLVTVTCRERAHAAGKAEPSGPERGTEPWHEVLLGSLPAEKDLRGPAVVGPHGWRYGRVIWTAEECRLWLDGTEGPAFDNLLTLFLFDVGNVCDYAFSADGTRLAYAAGKQGRMQMVVDGKGGPTEELVTRPLFSPDGRRLAFLVRCGGKSYVRLDGALGQAFDHIAPRDLVFSPDSRRCAYVGGRGQSLIMVVDQQERADWPGAGRPVFSPDSQHVAYATSRGLVLDGHLTAWGAGEMEDVAWPVFSPDSQHVAASGGPFMNTHTAAAAILDGRPLSLPNAGQDCCQVVFSPDLKRHACRMRKGSRQWVVLDGSSGPEFDAICRLTITHAGLLAYVAQAGYTWSAVVGNEKGHGCDPNWSRLVSSPDGRRLAYIARVGPTWSVVVDGQAGPEHEGTASSDALGGQVQTPGVTEPDFSPDSRHVAYGARSDGQWVVLLDGAQVGGKYDEIVRGGPSFREDGTLEFLGMRSRALYRVTVRPPARLPQAAVGEDRER